MDISMFFVFPGVLVPIGIILLLISVIIIFVAYKSESSIKVDASLITPYKDKNSDINISKRKISTNKHIYDSNLVEEQPAMREPDKPKKETKKVEEKKEEPVKETKQEEPEEIVDAFEEEFKEKEPVKKPEPKKEEKTDDDDIELL